MPQVKFKRQTCYKGATYHRDEVVNLSAEDAVAVSSFAVDVRASEVKPQRNIVVRPEVKALESAKNTAITEEDKVVTPPVTEPTTAPAEDAKKADSKPKATKKKSSKSKKVVTK
jgi:hypothetical protein